MNEIFDSLMGGADYFAAACFHDALFDKVCFGQKNKNQIGRLSVAFSLFSIHSLSVNVFGISILPFVIFAFSAYGFLEIVIMAFMKENS